jgi:acetyl-CoA C-acetyltransferase
VPQGLWHYRDPGRVIASSIGANRAASIRAKVGVLQQSLIGDACKRIADGDNEVILLVGGEAGHRARRARHQDIELRDSQQDTVPDEVLRAAEVIMTEAEMASGLGTQAAGYYAIIDSAVRAAAGVPLSAHLEKIAERGSAFSKIAASNPHAWTRQSVTADAVRHCSPTNPMLAFPYSATHATTWSVDQASALLLCSARAATAAGVPPPRRIHPVVSSTSEHMVPLSARPDLARFVGAELAAAAALEFVGGSPRALTHLELYSCFPVAVDVHAQALGIEGQPQLSVTGGMRFAGGPFNNFVLHATGQLAGQLRRSSAGTGLVSSVSGVLTKHGFGVWSRTRPREQFEAVDVTKAVEARTTPRDVVTGASGDASIAGYTVLYERGAPCRAVAVLDLDDGCRAIAHSEDAALISHLLDSESVGMHVHVEDNRFDTQTGATAHG